jgi:hypothetical protein
MMQTVGLPHQLKHWAIGERPLSIFFSFDFLTCSDLEVNSVALVRQLTIPTERSLLGGEVSANSCE